MDQGCDDKRVSVGEIKMTEKVIIAGSGGQGIMLMGKILAQAAMEEGRHVTWFPSYGAEVRGGTAHCTVIISDDLIGSPCIDKTDTLIALNGPSAEKFAPRVAKGGLVITNSSLAQKPADKKGNKSLSRPFTEEAIRLGNARVANMIALGAYIGAKGIVRPESVFSVIEDIAPADKKALIEINKEALKKGMES